MKLKSLSLLLVVLYFYSCSAQTSEDLYSSLEKYYPASKYLAAVGEGDTKKDAEKNAMGKLSLIFESKIDYNQTLNEHFTEFSDNDGSSLVYESSTQKRTNLQSNQNLMNVKFGKYSVDELGNNFVVAYIDRRETAAIYDEKINDVHQSILDLENIANSSNEKIKKYAALNRASGLMNSNLELMKQQTIISPYNPDFSDKISKYNSIYEEKGKIASSIKFKISEKSDADIIDALSSLITSKGFKIGDNADFIVTASLKYENVDLGRKEIFYNWFMNIELKNAENEIIFNFEKSGREGGISASAVYARAKFEANRTLKKEFIIGFDKYLNSLLGH